MFQTGVTSEESDLGDFVGFPSKKGYIIYQGNKSDWL